MLTQLNLTHQREIKQAYTNKRKKSLQDLINMSIVFANQILGENSRLKENSLKKNS